MAKRKGKESSMDLYDGKFKVRISLAEIKNGKNDKKAKVLHVTFTSKKANCKKFYNIKNSNSQAQDIGLSELDHLAFCCGIKKYDPEKPKVFVGNDVIIHISNDGKYNSIDKIESKKKKKGGSPFK